MAAPPDFGTPLTCFVGPTGAPPNAIFTMTVLTIEYGWVFRQANFLLFKSSTFLSFLLDPIFGSEMVPEPKQKENQGIDMFFPNHPVVLGPRFEETAPRVTLTPPPAAPPSSLLPSSHPCLCHFGTPLTRFVAP